MNANHSKGESEVRKIAHISDLHFGKENPLAATSLYEDLMVEKPCLIVVSGDLTQRARTREFVAARAFLDGIPFPKVIVPGNHDIPLYNPYKRFFKRLTAYRLHIARMSPDIYEDDLLAVFGINTSRSFSFKEGRISLEQIARLEKDLMKAGNNKMKVVVVHHPLSTLKRSHLALPVLEECGVDLVLAGHAHEASIQDLKTDLALTDRSILAIGAGTAISNRTRGEPNSYNILSVAADKIHLCLKVLQNDQFVGHKHSLFTRTNNQWVQG